MKNKRSERYYKFKIELFMAAFSVIVSAASLVSATYAWFVTNSTVKGTTSTISALANGMVLQIVQGTTPEYGSDHWTIAADTGHEISPSSTNDVVNWYVPRSWSGSSVSTYDIPDLDDSGKYIVQGKDFYAYVLTEFTLYTINETGIADVYLDDSVTGGPIQITGSDDATQEWLEKIKGCIRVGIVIDDELKVVYAPKQPSSSETGNDVNATIGWSCVDAGKTATTTATYKHIYGNVFTDQDGGNWSVTKDASGAYVKPASNPQPIASHVDYNGVSMKLYIWMEGTDSDCINVNGLEEGDVKPTFDVSIYLAGLITE